MAKSLVVISTDADLHRFRNFAEELSLELGDAGALPIEEADKAVDRVFVQKVQNRGVCESIIKRVARRHRLTIAVQKG